MSDYFEHAQNLQVIDVWRPDNVTGWVTPRVLYDPTVKNAQGQVIAPRAQSFRFWIDHGTVGTNTLMFWGQGGSIAAGSLAHYLIPKDSTQYADGLIHDTRRVVFKMVPDGYACNNVGDAINPITNRNTMSVEYESKQNGRHDITELQYIKGALVYAYDARRYSIPDHFRLPHGVVAVPWGRRTDPWAGRFDIAYSWEIVQQARRDPRIRQLWGWEL